MDAGEVAKLLGYLSGYEPPQVKSAMEAALLVEAMVATALLAGLRKGELFALTWPDVDLDHAILTVAHSYDGPPKNGRIRHVPMPPPLIRMLRSWESSCPETPQGLVFPVRVVPRATKKPPAEPKPPCYRMGTRNEDLGLAGIMKAAGCHVPLKPWHALRHTYASTLAMKGIPLHAIAQVLGHASVEMTQIYAHLSPAYLSDQIAKLDYPKLKIANVSDITQARKNQAGKKPRTLAI